MNRTDGSTPPAFMSDEELLAVIERNKKEMTSLPGADMREIARVSGGMFFPLLEFVRNMVSIVHYEEEKKRGRRVAKSFEETMDHARGCQECRGALECAIWFFQQCLTGAEWLNFRKEETL